MIPGECMAPSEDSILLVRTNIKTRFLRPLWLTTFLVGLCISGSLVGSAADIVINEVLASNSKHAPLAAYPDYFPDYIEIYNSTASDIRLGPTNAGPSGNWILSTKKNPDPANQAEFFRFPAGSMIPADSYLLIFMDDQTNFPGIHTTFIAYGTNKTTLTLGRTGGRVKLYNLNLPDTFAFDFSDQLVDTIEFGHQIPNLSLGRVPEFTGNFTLTRPTPAGGTIPYTANTPYPFMSAPTSSNQFTLKINEWMATNSVGWDQDWLEVYNPDTNIIAISGLVFVDKLSNLAVPAESRPIPALSFIAPLGFVQLFASKNNDPDAPANELGFSISSDSVEPIYIVAGDRATVIDKVTSNNPQRNKTQGRIPDGEDVLIEQVLGQTRNRILPNTSPEESNFASIPEIVINEVLTHTAPPLEDAIELANTTGTSQNIGDWWLTDDQDNPKKYKIPSGTSIPPYGFKVFYESQFNSTNPVIAAQPFALSSANGDECYLYKADSTGKLLGYRRGISFGPAANGVSFIRHVVTNSFETNVDMVASVELTLGTSVRAIDPASYLSVFRTGTGATNPAPLIGPVVINEIHYHPPAIASGINLIDDTFTEFIEIYNLSESAVLLFDPQQYFENNQRYADGRTNTWRLRGDVSFEFPEDSSLAAGKFALIVSFDPTNLLLLNNFTNKFPALASLIPSEVRIYGPYKGKLSNSGATVEVLRPDSPIGPTLPDFRLVPYYVVDRVNYNDEVPWPISPDGNGTGTGDSLQKRSSYDYGNDPLSWIGAAPTPGKFNTLLGLEPPSILRQPQSLTPTLGESANFAVTASSRGRLAYLWRKNGVNIPDATNATYMILVVTDSDAGNYSVVVSNLFGKVTSDDAVLTVLTTPVFRTQPLAQSIGVGSNVTLSASAYGAAPLVFQWYLSGNPVGAPTVGANVSVLALTNVQTSQAGLYRVEVFNGYGSATSSEAELSVVVYPPDILIAPSNQNRMVDSSVMFTVAVGGTPPFLYQWRFNSGDIPGATNAVYTIPVVAVADGGAYSVVVANSAGSVTSDTATLSVIVPPTLGLHLLAGYPVLRLGGMLGSNFSVQYSSDLSGTNWTSLRSFSNLSVNPYQFLDAGGSTSPARFYRAVMQ